MKSYNRRRADKYEILFESYLSSNNAEIAEVLNSFFLKVIDDKSSSIVQNGSEIEEI